MTEHCDNAVAWPRIDAILPATHHVTGQDFEALLGAPLLFAGSFRDTRATRFWTADYLRRAVGNKRVPVFVSVDGRFPGGAGPRDATRYSFVTMTVSECIDRLLGAPSPPILAPGEKCYLYQSPAELYQEVLTDVPTPIYVPRALRASLTQQLWIGGPGNVTPVHYDMSENILVQVVGTKTVLLWDPAQYPLLYLSPLRTTHDRQSPIDLDSPDLARFPRFVHARALRCDLGPGDALYIPACWMHHVRSHEFSISVNFWWELPEILELSQLLQATEHSPLDWKDHAVTAQLRKWRPQLRELLHHLAADGSIPARYVERLRRALAAG